MRLKYSRQDQLDNLRGAGWKIVTFKAVPVVIAFHDMGGKRHVKGWKGKGDKTSFYYSFRTPDLAQAFVERFVESVKRGVDSRATRTAEKSKLRASLKASDHYTVGDVLYDSWGYDQTNIDWFEVVGLKPKSILIRSISRNYAETQNLAGRSQPIRGIYSGEAILKPLNADGRITSKHGSFSKWNGKAVYESHYA